MMARTTFSVQGQFNSSLRRAVGAAQRGERGGAKGEDFSRPLASADCRNSIYTSTQKGSFRCFRVRARNRTESFAHKMPPRGNKLCKGPRSLAGGYSARHAERSAARGVVKQNAPSWNDATASIFMEELKIVAGDSSGRLGKKVVLDLFRDPLGMATVVKQACTRLSARDRELVKLIVGSGQTKVSAKMADDDLPGAETQVQSFLKPLRERLAARTPVKELVVPFARYGPTTFHGWLSVDPQRDRLRDIKKNNRILLGLSKWPLGWLKEPGVVCYERAQGRVKKERPGCDGSPDVEFTRGLVKFKELPTALANASDHYVVLAPGEEPRFMSVEESARAFMVPETSSLMVSLVTSKTQGGWLTAAQAVSCLGRCVHVGVARQIVLLLKARGMAYRGMRYASAFSGIDTFAAALEQELGDGFGFSYVFASEQDKSVRRALIAAWCEHGLVPDQCDVDATSEASIHREEVDLFVITPTCESYSKRNHLVGVAESTAQNMATSKVWQALGYVRLRRPRVVVVENVAEASAQGPITGLLSRIEGYTLEACVLGPQDAAGAPMARDRQFWILTRK
jgi:hypothetical protein